MYFWNRMMSTSIDGEIERTRQSKRVECEYVIRWEDKRTRIEKREWSAVIHSTSLSLYTSSAALYINSVIFGQSRIVRRSPLLSRECEECLFTAIDAACLHWHSVASLITPTDNYSTEGSVAVIQCIWILHFGRTFFQWVQWAACVVCRGHSFCLYF